MKNNVSRAVGDAATVSSLAKNTNANSLRTAKAVARWGENARYPICLAALDLWSLQARLSKLKKELEEVPSSAEQPKRHKQIEYFLSLELYEEALERFERECDAVGHTRDIKAFRAYQRLKKRRHNGPDGVHLTNGDKRVIGLLDILHKKVIEAALMKDGVVGVYREIDGDRLLSDKIFQGRLTAGEIRSWLVAKHGPEVAGDKYAKEVRRCARKLEISLAEDRRGRKWKPPYPTKHKPKQSKPRGRPRIRPSIRWSDVVLLGVDTTPIEAARARRLMCVGGVDVEVESVLDKEKTTDYSLFEDADALRTGKTWTVKIYSNRSLWDVRHEVQKHPISLLPPNPQNWRLPLPECVEIRGEPESVTQGRSIVFTALLDSSPSGRFYDDFCERPVLRKPCDPEKEEKERSKWRKEAAARDALLTRCKVLKKR
jgi:hypothetical protein